MKITQLTVELKDGLPNYSSRTASVIVVADENESIDVTQTIAGCYTAIRAGWNLQTGVLTLPVVSSDAVKEPNSKGGTDVKSALTVKASDIVKGKKKTKSYDDDDLNID